jgi:hypothetical protein
MSLSAAVLDALVAAGATQEQLVAAMKADIAERARAEAERLEKKREGNRTRQRRKRNAVSRDVTPVTRDKCDTPPNESILSPREASEAKASLPQPRPWSLPVGVSLQVWTDFLTNRKRKRFPNTPTAWKSFTDDLVRVSLQTGIPPPKLIEQCTAKGWGAIYDPRDNRNGGTQQGIGKTTAAIAGLGHWDDDRPM